MNQENRVWIPDCRDDDSIILKEWRIDVAMPMISTLPDSDKKKIQYDINVTEQQIHDIFDWISCGYNKVAMILGKEAFSDLCQKMSTALEL